MRVQRVLVPGSMAESWTLLGDDLRPVGPVESFELLDPWIRRAFSPTNLRITLQA